jgi:S-adenosylmethionine-diacylglycerol 3-amino-3-carboxypropyl transferase
MLHDFTFQAAFSRLFVYNILFEDTEVDGRYFRLDTESRVLGISAAGCGLASMLRFHPQSIDAVDINHHHLALAALRIAASQHLKDFDTFYQLFGEGRLHDPETTISELAEKLPVPFQKYWRKHNQRFKRGLYDSGLTAFMLRWLRRKMRVGGEWMSQFVHKSPEERVTEVRELLEPVFRQRIVRHVLNSPLQQLALGVNFAQRSKITGQSADEFVEFFVDHCARVAATDCTTNWFAWYAIAGHYNHSDPRAVPPYLRRTEHQKSLMAPTETSYHHRSIHDVLNTAKMNTWTHYSLCDAVDWMQEREQRQLFEQVHRTARPGAIVLMRSVSRRNVIDELGLTRNFVHLSEISSQATEEERSRQYRRVDFFQVRA